MDLSGDLCVKRSNGRHTYGIHASRVKLNPTTRWIHLQVIQGPWWLYEIHYQSMGDNLRLALPPLRAYPFGTLNYSITASHSVTLTITTAWLTTVNMAIAAIWEISKHRHRHRHPAMGFSPIDRNRWTSNRCRLSVKDSIYLLTYIFTCMHFEYSLTAEGTEMLQRSDHFLEVQDCN